MHILLHLVQTNGDWLDLANHKNISADIAPTAGQMASQPPRCEAERVKGEAAKARLLALLNAGKFSLSAGLRDEDKYGRKLRSVTRAGRSLGDTLVNEDLAPALGRCQTRMVRLRIRERIVTGWPKPPRGFGERERVEPCAEGVAPKPVMTFPISSPM